jgi:hypothetical protein
MAYNPFSVFRKNQKAIFAVITVFIMFTFVLSSGIGGGADFFDWFPRWIGGKSQKGDHFATLAGDKIYSSDVDQVRFQRILANRFMVMASLQAEDSLRRYVTDQIGRVSPDVRKAIERTEQAEQTLAMFSQNPQFAQFAQQFIQQFQMAYSQLRLLADNPNTRPEDREVLRAILAAYNLAQQRQFATESLYFINAPNQNVRDVIDFMIWEKKAEEMGIQFTDEDVKALIQREFHNQFKNDVPVREALQREYPGRFSLEALFKALNSEFRIRTAQSALLGPMTDRSGTTLTAAPVFNTPYELFDYYRDKTSPSTYEVLSVPVENFVPQVTATPPEGELRTLFDRRKDYEPDPAREEPGFREPRKVKVEWVSATGEEPYYQKAAKEWVTRADKIVGSEVWGLTVPLPGMLPGSWAAMVAGPMSVKEPLVYSKYKSTTDRHDMRLRFNWSGSSSFVMPGDILDTSVVQPQTLAAAVGGAAGAAAGFGNALLPANLLTSATIAAEQRARIRAGMPFVLGSVPSPGLFATAVASEAAFRKMLPKPLPIEAVKPELLKDLTESKARELAIADLKKLQTEVNKLSNSGKAKNTSAAKAYIAEFVKERGLKTGGTTELQSEWTIGDDPGMAPLKEILDKPGVHGNVPIPFGPRFFSTTEMGGRRSPATGDYRPEFYPEGADRNTAMPLTGEPDPVFLAWRTEDKPARSVTYQEARPRVVEAWKEQKARELAKAEAERIANEIRNSTATSSFQISQKLREARAQLESRATDPKAKERVRLFDIENVAPFQIKADRTGMSMGPSIQPFLYTPTKDIPYPTQEMQKLLLEDRTKPVKTVFMLPDQPKDRFYVFVLTDRRERSVGDFGGVYDSAMYGQVRQALAQAYRTQEGSEARESVLALIKRELNYVETEEQKKLIEERVKSGSD